MGMVGKMDTSMTAIEEQLTLLQVGMKTKVDLCLVEIH